MTTPSNPNLPQVNLDMMSSMGMRDLLFPPPQEILPGALSYLNLPFAVIPGYRILRLDLHVPRGAKQPVPVVVYASGGAWTLSIKHHGPWTFLPAAGYAVATVEYRVSGEARFPVPIHDLKGAVRWLRAKASTYNLDPGRIGGWGSSAGGHLMAMLAVTNGMPTFEGEVGENLEQSSSVLSVIDHYGVTDLAALAEDTNGIPRVIEYFGTATSPETRFLGYIPQENLEEAAKANPTTYVSSETVPFLIMHGDADTRVGIGQSRRFYQALRDAGVDVTFHVIPGANHGAPEFDADEAHALALGFLEKTLNMR
jgi:acetyl esterase/lipase